MSNRLQRARYQSPAAVNLDRNVAAATNLEPEDDTDANDDALDELEQEHELEPDAEPEPELVIKPGARADGSYEVLASNPRKQQAPATTPAPAPTPTVDLQQIAQTAAEHALRNVQQAHANVQHAPIFDVHDNRLTLSLTGSLLALLREQWTTFNSARTDKLPFSTYLSTRLQACSQHTDPRCLYIAGDNLQRIQTAAASDFQSAAELTSWILSTRSLALVSADGRSCLVDPIEPEVWDRLEWRLGDGETMRERVGEIVRRALADETGLS